MYAFCRSIQNKSLDKECSPVIEIIITNNTFHCHTTVKCLFQMHKGTFKQNIL